MPRKRRPSASVSNDLSGSSVEKEEEDPRAAPFCGFAVSIAAARLVLGGRCTCRAFSLLMASKVRITAMLLAMMVLNWASRIMHHCCHRERVVVTLPAVVAGYLAAAVKILIVAAALLADAVAVVLLVMFLAVHAVVVAVAFVVVPVVLLVAVLVAVLVLVFVVTLHVMVFVMVLVIVSVVAVVLVVVLAVPAPVLLVPPLP